jgi:hypothetical protein
METILQSVRGKMTDRLVAPLTKGMQRVTRCVELDGNIEHPYPVHA